jgi:hypothetical protein
MEFSSFPEAAQSPTYLSNPMLEFGPRLNFGDRQSYPLKFVKLSSGEHQSLEGWRRWARFLETCLLEGFGKTTKRSMAMKQAISNPLAASRVHPPNCPGTRKVTATSRNAPAVATETLENGRPTP